MESNFQKCTFLETRICSVILKLCKLFGTGICEEEGILPMDG